MGRIEYKYLVPNSCLGDLRKYLLSYLKYDKYAEIRPEKEYTVRSLYYDTINYDFYQDKIEGLNRRKKVRIRGYNKFTEDAFVFLEIKRKHGPTISKTRSPVAYRDLPVLIETGNVNKFIQPLNNDSFENARRFLFQTKNLGLMPTILINYDREAYFYKFDNDLRITFDKNIRSRMSSNLGALFVEGDPIRALPNHFILEIKTFSNFPGWLHYIIGYLELRQQALSKYTICLDSHGRNGFRVNSRLNNIGKINLNFRHEKQEVE